jgi:hypothetical protein
MHLFQNHVLSNDEDAAAIVHANMAQDDMTCQTSLKQLTHPAA